MNELAARFAAYLAERWTDASSIEVTSIERIYGGASRETYRTVARVK